MRTLIDDIHCCDANTEYFEEVHATGDFYGGSIVASICGLNPFQSPLDVWLVKTGKRARGAMSAQMRLGLMLEPLIAQLIAEKLEKAVERKHSVYQSDDLDWAICTPDAILPDEQALVEIKTHKVYADRYWSDTAASDAAQCQLQWGMGVMGLKSGYCCALIGGDADRLYTPHFEADPAVFSQLVEQVGKFRELVLADTPPGAGPGDAQAIKELIAIDKSREIDLSKELASDYAEYRRAKHNLDMIMPQIQEYEKIVKSFRNEIALRSAGAGLVRLPEGYAKVSKITRKAYQVEESSYLQVTVKEDRENGDK